jgi:hypothetical protein
MRNNEKLVVVVVGKTVQDIEEKIGEQVVGT